MRPDGSGGGARSDDRRPASSPHSEPWSHAGPDDPSPPEVAVLVYRGASSSEVELVGDALAQALGARLRLASVDGGPVVGVEPARQILTEPLSEVPIPYGLVVPGGLGWKREARRPEVVDWLGRAVIEARGVLAVSTGSLLIASVGHLAGREATGHWLGGRLLAEMGAEPSRERIVRGRLLVTATGARAGVEAAPELAREMRFGPW